MLTLLQRVLREVDAAVLAASITVIDGFTIRIASLPLHPRETD